MREVVGFVLIANGVEPGSLQPTSTLMVSLSNHAQQSRQPIRR
ncbi:hypothetical protein C7476_10648 [Phyllobacterium bourgognense]|uniref:Uncharacterized protein n=1 Tax=Phyllobacterium bourgognense TaxID=314236 RepID=A0A368YVN3_9HYPH|nr:hypothetical protein C7476_10648 [Phyllobacterium bourgognense]